MAVSEALKYLGSGVIVYGVVAACTSTMDHMESGTPGSMGGDSSMSEGGGPVRPVHAQDDCGSCELSGPIQIEDPVAIEGPVEIDQPIEVAGPLQVVTADADLERVRAGSSISAGEELAAGPLIVTHLVASGDSVTAFIRENECAGMEATLTTFVVDPQSGIQNAQIPVPAGAVLCSGSIGPQGRLHWSGFVPY